MCPEELVSSHYSNNARVMAGGHALALHCQMNRLFYQLYFIQLLIIKCSSVVK